MNGFADSKIRSATADIARHSRVDMSVSGFRCLREQRSGRHDLSGLTVTALWNVNLLPGFLQRMGSVSGQPFDGRDRFAADCSDLSLASAYRVSIDVNGAGSAGADAATKLRPFHIQRVTEYPEHGHFRRDIHRL